MKTRVCKKIFAVKFVAVLLCFCAALFSLASCASPDGVYNGGNDYNETGISLPTERGDSFREINERDFIKTEVCSSSTFSLSASRSSYSYMRKAVN